MSQYRFIHLGEFGGRVTVCYQFDQEKGAAQRSITASFAWSNPNDQFRKALGRLKSSKKFESGHTHKIDLSEGVMISDSVKTYILSGIDLETMALTQRANLGSFVPKWFQQEYYQQEFDRQMEVLVRAGMQARGQHSDSCCGGHCH